MGPDFILTYKSTDIFSPFDSRHAFFFLICGRESLYHIRSTSKDLLRLTLFWYKPLSFSCGNYVTWHQAQFSFRFVNHKHSGGQGETKREPDTNLLPPTFLIDWYLLNQLTKITSVACFFSMQIFHTWENCRLAEVKNSFSLLCHCVPPQRKSLSSNQQKGNNTLK